MHGCVQRYEPHLFVHVDVFVVSEKKRIKMSDNKVIVIKIYLTYFAFTAYYQSAIGIYSYDYDCLINMSIIFVVHSTDLSMIMSSRKLKHCNIVMINNL